MSEQIPEGEVELTPEQQQAVAQMMEEQQLRILRANAEATPPAEILGGGILEEEIEMYDGSKESVLVISLLVLPEGSPDQPKAFRIQLLVEKEFGAQLGIHPTPSLLETPAEDNDQEVSK